MIWKPSETQIGVISGHWMRFDWRCNPFAPGLSILQALTQGQRTASGTGTARQTALNRCLAETAEILALGLSSEGETQPLDTSRDGIAAHPDPGRAEVLAMLEAYERHAVAQWWHGNAQAAPVDPLWCLDLGITGWIGQMREGAAMRRESRLYRLSPVPAPAVMLAVSTTPNGQEPVVGFGCALDPREAALKAMREHLQMELPLAELYASRQPDEVGFGSALPVRQNRLRQRLGGAKRDDGGVVPISGPESIGIDLLSKWIGRAASCARLGQTLGGLSVATCRVAGLPPDFSDVSPFGQFAGVQK